ncbi:hypothetical protein EG68_01953 [Paragonimus skrjabini miyazakii]|uniref:Ig-like domain-containing protein n=1 Tax=Paragonimus skrjabini miyazakii TaxID=59628 RepID=A0A8S9Z4X1_9TREM|nr:hypothetical protein EG68_01953 [Paragonimus skrjabini miyazakii]
MRDIKRISGYIKNHLNERLWPGKTSPVRQLLRVVHGLEWRWYCLLIKEYVLHNHLWILTTFLIAIGNLLSPYSGFCCMKSLFGYLDSTRPPFLNSGYISRSVSERDVFFSDLHRPINFLLQSIKLLDVKIVPSAEAFLFQDLLNLSQVIETREKPRIVREPSSVYTLVGQSALFVCLVEGNPAPKVQWKVSGVAVSEAHFGQTVRAPRGSVLRVANTLPNHNGAIITCTATNALGRAEASAKLVVYADEAGEFGFCSYI